MMTKQDAESDEQKQIHNEKVRLAMMKKRDAESDEQKQNHNEKKRLSIKRKRGAEKIKLDSKTAEHKDYMEDVISRSKKKALKFLHRIKDLKNPHKHRAIVCIICNRFTI